MVLWNGVSIRDVPDFIFPNSARAGFGRIYENKSGSQKTGRLRQTSPAGSQWPNTQRVLLIVMLLIAQALATAAYRLFGFDTIGLHAGKFLKNVIFVTTTPIDINPSSCHGHHSSVCKILPSYDAAFRRR